MTITHGTKVSFLHDGLYFDGVVIAHQQNDRVLLEVLPCKELQLVHHDSKDHIAYEVELKRRGVCIECQGYGQDWYDGASCMGCNGTGKINKPNSLTTFGIVGGALLGAALTSMGGNQTNMRVVEDEEVELDAENEVEMNNEHSV